MLGERVDQCLREDLAFYRSDRRLFALKVYVYLSYPWNLQERRLDARRSADRSGHPCNVQHDSILGLGDDGGRLRRRACGREEPKDLMREKGERQNEGRQNPEHDFIQ